MTGLDAKLARREAGLAPEDETLGQARNTGALRDDPDYARRWLDHELVRAGGRVTHARTGLRGDVVHAWELDEQFGGDLAGTWVLVRWDDGFECDVPAASALPGEREVPRTGACDCLQDGPG